MTDFELTSYMSSQLDNFFPNEKGSFTAVERILRHSLERLRYSMSHVKLAGYTNFSVLHSDLYAQFLYFAANCAWQELQDKELATKLFYLNKALHGINCMYDTELPNVFLIVHAVGTVLGKARYGEYLVICQNVTVGADRGEAPVFSNGTYLGPGSAVVGGSILGARTIVALNSTIRGENISGDCVVSGRSPNLAIRPINRDILFDTYFNGKSSKGE